MKVYNNPRNFKGIKKIKTVFPVALHYLSDKLALFFIVESSRVQNLLNDDLARHLKEKIYENRNNKDEILKLKETICNYANDYTIYNFCEQFTYINLQFYEDASLLFGSKYSVPDIDDLMKLSLVEYIEKNISYDQSDDQVLGKIINLVRFEFFKFMPFAIVDYNLLPKFNYRDDSDLRIDRKNYMNDCISELIRQVNQFSFI